MSVAITIRNVPQKTRDELAARAAREGTSLQQFLRATLINLAEVPTVDQILDRAVVRKRAADLHIDAQTILDDIRAERR